MELINVLTNDRIVHLVIVLILLCWLECILYRVGGDAGLVGMGGSLPVPEDPAVSHLLVASPFGPGRFFRNFMLNPVNSPLFSLGLFDDHC